ncbi:high-affinity methionine permease [Colletotrichum phormii]|uniref:High-affinity methionine permease n=1 Tax=Colletotrichum phormii TaxID=359342 RepID=A0AAJ0E9U2_9PEZI|nr:high-affinity methionine permease [Colletotrichum phormii]KAK1623926.1 high-affinity methionine permease [Colletotrichum phormii]
MANSGTGIFMSPQRVMKGTRSVGATLLLWVAGIIYCLCGTHVYIEYGLNVPRYLINGQDQSVPRSGGDLVYLQYVFRKPAYRKNTLLLSTCIFGISFIVLGNMAGNSIHFAIRLLEAADVKPENGPVRGIALAVATFSCGIHAFSRRGGILLNNVLAVVKILTMLLIIVATIVVATKGFPGANNVFDKNTSPETSFKNASNEANSYAQAFLAIIFSFSGFEQPNYVLGEISRPKKKFPVAMGAGVGTVVTLYLVVNICYMVVVPKDDQINANVAQKFFELTFQTLEPESDLGARIFNAFLAISSLGNIIVMTYTAARVKQEIAKEGMLPWPKFFAQNTDMSIGRVLRWFQRKGWFSSVLRLKWLSPEHHSEKTPVGALLLHFVSCTILIFATYKMEPTNAYILLTSLSAYVINAFIGTFLGLGILILRFRGPPTTLADDDASTFGKDTPPPPLTWAEMTGKRFRPFLSVFCAFVYMCGGLFPVITNWVHPSGQLSTQLDWWLVPTVSWIIITLGVAWFIGFVLVARYIERKDHRVFVVEKKPEFEPAQGSSQGSEAGIGTDLIQVHETVYLSWVGKEALRSRRPVFDDSRQNADVREVPASPFAGTDFAAFMQQAPGRGGHW